MAVRIIREEYCDAHPDAGGKSNKPTCKDKDTVKTRVIYNPHNGLGYEIELCHEAYEGLIKPAVYKVIDLARELPPHECPVPEKAGGRRVKGKNSTDYKGIAIRKFFADNPTLGTIAPRGRMAAALVALFDNRFPEWEGWETGDDLPEGWTPEGAKASAPQSVATDTPEEPDSEEGQGHEEEDPEEETEEEEEEVPSTAPFSEGDPRNLGRDFTPAFTG